MTCALVGCTGVSPSPRTLHCAGSKGNSLYIWGGGYEGSSPTPDTKLHVFDANTETWSQPTVKGKLPSARHGHILCVIDNHLYIHGGMAGATFHKDLHSINLTDLTCSRLKPRGEVPCARAAHAAASHNKLLFIFGGMSQHGSMDDLSSLNTDTMIWSKVTFDSPMPTPRLDHSMFIAQIVCNKDVPNVTPSTPPTTPVATGGQNIIPVDLWHGVVTRGNDGVETRGNDGVVTRGNDGVETRGNDGVVTRGNDGVEPRG
uniref:Rab9 effector protein with kelch motifs n=2 Tax=Ciona intestinalis TaxID=7719 RepID=F6ZQ03_CIOIN